MSLYKNTCAQCGFSVPHNALLCDACTFEFKQSLLLTADNYGPLKDSGARREFETGAVRDVSEGKGRCDLLPLDAVAMCMSEHVRPIFRAIECFKRNKDRGELVYAINTFAEYTNTDIYTLILEVSKHYEDGAKKYSENNWMKGISLHCFIDSGVRHYLKHLRGDTDEPHDRAFVWNMLGAIWTYTNMPELDDVMLDLNGHETE